MNRKVRITLVILITLLLVAAAAFPMLSNSAPAYIGNVKSCVFHKQSCRYLPHESNRLYFDSRKEAIDAGYRPCRKCRP